VWKDVDEMLASKGMNSIGYETKISVDDFCEWFGQISPWSHFLRDGNLNIRKLFDHVDEFKDACKWEMPLVVDGFVDIFCFKSLSFMVCRGTMKEKVKMLWDFLEPLVTAYNKKRMPHFSTRFKKFFVNVFFFSDVFIRRFHHHYEEELTPSKFLLKYTISSVQGDPKGPDPFLEHEL
jgi:hypothetical protein